MTINEARKFFEGLKSEAQKKSEKKIYEQFLGILSGLKNKDLSAEEVQWIEKELDSLDLRTTPAKRKRYFRTALRKFKKYLKDTFTFITKRYYSEMGVALGLNFGILFGIVILSSLERSTGIAVGLAVGMAAGIIIGGRLDARAMKEGRVI
jgi:hypothetical protein